MTLPTAKKISYECDEEPTECIKKAYGAVAKELRGIYVIHLLSQHPHSSATFEIKRIVEQLEKEAGR